MEIKKVNNNPFGMSWNKAAKPLLAEAVATLSPTRQSKAVEIINYLEQNSPYHKLSINSRLGYLQAESLCPEVDRLSTDFFPGKSKIGFFSALKGLAKLVKSENEALPKKQPLYSSLSEALSCITKRTVLASGVRMFDDSSPKLFSRWAGEAARSGRTAESIAEQIKRIDNFAKQNELKVYIQNSSVDARTKTLEKIFGFENKKVELKHLDYIEKSLKTYINMQKAKAALSYSFDEAKTRLNEAKTIAGTTCSKLAERAKQTKAYGFFISIKEKIAQKAKEIGTQQEQARKVSAQKISEEIKI